MTPNPAVALLTWTYLAVAAHTACAAPRDGLVAHYPFDGNAEDAGGRTNHALVCGAVSGPGFRGLAYAFDGVHDYIENTAPVDLSIGDRNWTVAAWINTQTQAGPQTILSRYACGMNPGCDQARSEGALYSLHLADGGRPEFSVGDDTHGVERFSVRSDRCIAAGTWHHLAGVLDRGAARLSLFVDGTLAGTTAVTGITGITDDESPLEIGRLFRRGWAAPDAYFHGSIDDVRIYNRALSAAEVAQLVGVPVPPASVGCYTGPSLPQPAPHGASAAAPAPAAGEQRDDPDATGRGHDSAATVPPLPARQSPAPAAPHGPYGQSSTSTAAPNVCGQSPTPAAPPGPYGQSSTPTAPAGPYLAYSRPSGSVFKCVDEHGETTFQTIECRSSATSSRIATVADPLGGAPGPTIEEQLRYFERQRAARPHWDNQVLVIGRPPPPVCGPHDRPGQSGGNSH